MAPKLSGGTAADGVVVYQDSNDENQFHYLPANADCILGETLEDFQVKYWGIGKAYLVVDSNNNIKSLTGAVLSGRAKIDITDDQRKKILAVIKNAYPNSQNPKLKPIVLKNVHVQPIIGTKTLMLGEGADVEFPDIIQLGAMFNYQIATGNSLFASFVGAQVAGEKAVYDPSFGLNIAGEVEFQGDPWTVKVTADLSQVWSYTRKRFNAGLNFGWFQIPLLDYEQLIVDMNKDKIIKLEFIEGSLDNEKYGRQIFEMGKDMFEEVNRLAGAGEGFFKFEPNPTPMTSDKPNTALSWAFRMFMNVGYGEQSIKSTQNMHWETEISYTGKVVRLMPSSMTLAVGCNNATNQLFQDLGDMTNPCITQAKVDALQTRLEKEREKKEALVDQLLTKYVLGDMTEEQYYAAIALVNGITPTEDGFLTDPQVVEVGDFKYSLPGRSLVGALSETDVWQFLLGREGAD